MEDEHATRRRHIVPEAIKAIRAELIQKAPDRPLRRSTEASPGKKKPVAANLTG